MMQLFPHIILRDLTRPVKDRGHAPYSACGPYMFDPAPSRMRREGWSSYTDASETMTQFRLRYEDANEHLSYGCRERRITGYWTDKDGTGDTIKPVVFRLPRKRGWLAGWTMGVGMCASLDAGVFEDPKDAAYAAHDIADRAAERERDYQAEQLEEDQDKDEEPDQDEEPDRAPVLLPDWLVKQYEQHAQAEREDGGSCSINTSIPTVAIVMANGETWFYQEHEAQKLLDEVPDNLRPEDYLLASAQNW